jgi:hydroxyethylthiazole kinase-like uncharacterized protein yjeF
MSGGADPAALGDDLIDHWPLPVDEGGDKHVRGTVLVVGGSPVTPGAVVLAGIAALRMGAGRLQLATASGPAPAVAVSVPEALVMPLDVDGDGFAAGAADVAADLASRADAVVIGPGMRGHDGAADFVSTILAGMGDGTVVVLDALAMQVVATLDDAVLAPLRGRLVLTPNRQELARLHDPDADVREVSSEQDADAMLRSVATRFGAVITSFGEIAAPDGRRWACGDGTPGLGTSGSGDVLAGLIGGAAARSGDAAQAACWGTYVHHAAGCRLSNRMGRLGFLARELLAEVPSLWADLEHRAR